MNLPSFLIQQSFERVDELEVGGGCDIVMSLQLQ